MHDVAKLAGVSQSTVSRVLSTTPSPISISEPTRQKILDAAEQLCYRPNWTARSLRTLHTQMIAVLIADISNSFYHPMVRAIQDVARLHQYLHGPRISWLGLASLVIPTLSVTTVWWTFGFPMLVFLAGLQGIPEPLYEAGKIDGAGTWQSFTRITLPLISPTMLFVVVTQFIGHMQVFAQPFAITGGGPGNESRSVVMYLYETAWKFFRFGYASTMAVALAAIMIIITVIQFRLLRNRTEY